MPTPTDLESLTDSQLVQRYEAVRTDRSHPDRNALLRTIEIRASRQTSVDDPVTGISYVWDGETESVVRRVADKGVVAEKVRFLKPTKVGRAIHLMSCHKSRLDHKSGRRSH